MPSIANTQSRRLEELHTKRADLERRLERQKDAAEALGNLGRMDRYILARKAAKALADDLHEVNATIARLETPTIVMGRGPGNFPKRKYSERVPR